MYRPPDDPRRDLAHRIIHLGGYLTTAAVVIGGPGAAAIHDQPVALAIAQVRLAPLHAPGTATAALTVPVRFDQPAVTGTAFGGSLG